MSDARQFFKPEEVASIKEAIIAAELRTSGEIRVFIESRCPTDLKTRTLAVFDDLKLNNTAARNGVLFYLAIDDHLFSIWGDGGINQQVPADFWVEIRNHMEAHFRAGRFTEGLLEGIAMAGEKLRTHFPYNERDINELHDDVVFG